MATTQRLYDTPANKEHNLTNLLDEKGEVTIGRAKECDIALGTTPKGKRITNPEKSAALSHASRYHAKIFQAPIKCAVAVLLMRLVLLGWPVSLFLFLLFNVRAHQAGFRLLGRHRSGGLALAMPSQKQQSVF